MVLHLITGLDGGGAETLLRSFVTHPYPRRFAHVVVSMTGDGTIGPVIRAAGIEVHTLDMVRGRPTLRGLVRLWRILSTHRPAVVQCWMYHANLLGTLLAWPRRTPHMWCLHAADVDGMQYNRVFRWTRSLCAILSPLPDMLVANSAVTQEDHARLGFKPRRWEIIGNGFDTAQFAPDPAARARIRQSLQIPEPAPVIGLFARFDPMKDHETFLRAAELLAQRRPDVRFLLAGPGVTAGNERLAELIRTTCPSGRMHLLGFRHDISALTSALDVATSTSIFGESFSNTMAEAMACGVPCVVTRVAALPSLVQDTGVVVPARDPAALVDGWEAILRLSPSERARLGQRARDRILTHFTIERMIERFETLYTELAPSDTDARALA